METNNEKRVLNIELNEEVKKVSITGTNSDDQVVMRQELSEDDLDQAAGGIHRVDDIPRSASACPVFTPSRKFYKDSTVYKP